jgi:cation transport ATPase
LKKDVPPVNNIQAIQGRGVKAIHNDAAVIIGNSELFTENGQMIPEEIAGKVASLESAGNTTMLVQCSQGRSKSYCAATASYRYSQNHHAYRRQPEGG